MLNVYISRDREIMGHLRITKHEDEFGEFKIWKVVKDGGGIIFGVIFHSHITYDGGINTFVEHCKIHGLEVLESLTDYYCENETNSFIGEKWDERRNQ